MTISPKGLQLILDWEVGGGRAYYDKHCRKPTVPGAGNTSSGVTIGIGYDLGQHDAKTFQKEWKLFLQEDELQALAKACGLRGKRAVEGLRVLGDIVIEWQDALPQFQTWTLPRFLRTTLSTFPRLEIAPTCVQEALLSLVFNRGTSMFGERRSEMRAIRDLVFAGDWTGIPEQLRDMQRLWPNTEGLRNRREAEAKHIEEGLASK